jgi:hypothetical protein
MDRRRGCGAGMRSERQPIIEEDEKPEPEREPQPATESAGGVRPPGRIGGGLQDRNGGEDSRPVTHRRAAPNNRMYSGGET